MLHARMSTDYRMNDVRSVLFEAAVVRTVVTWVRPAAVVYLSIFVSASLPTTGVHLHACGK